MNAVDQILTSSDLDTLVGFLAIDSVTPMETEAASDLDVLARRIAAYAEEAGMETVLLEPPPESRLRRADVPRSVTEVADRMMGLFLACQPNLLLSIGRPQARQRTLMFNVHIDTVGGLFPVCRAENKIFGRGVIDAKGLVVPVIAGIRHAFLSDPALADRVCVLLQCVSGEEGGAMGVYGTRHLFEQGYYGALNIVVEPTGLRYFDRSTTSMTARVSVGGSGSTDDQPQQGENATVLLAAVVHRLASELVPKIADVGAKMCIAGLHTGFMHNRVYGQGALLVNFAYPTLAVARQIERLTRETFGAAVGRFRDDFAQSPMFARTAQSAARICRMEWLKRGLPVLDNRDAALESMLAGIDIDRHGDDAEASRFTCDAMWLQSDDCYTIVFGPADLGDNKAHATGEYVNVGDLQSFAAAVSRIVQAFATRSI